LVTTAAGTATAATTAVTATNIAGGIASQIPYQTGAGATSFIANGTAGQVLTSNGTSAPAFATPAAGGGKTLISSTTSASGATTVTLSSIPQTYKSLELQISHINYGNPSNYLLSFNGETSTYYYSYTGLTASNSSTGSVAGSSATITYGNNQATIQTPAVTSKSVVTATIQNYSSSSLFKSGVMNGALTYMTSTLYHGTFHWSGPMGSTGAITSITINGGTAAGRNMIIDLYGVN
jgi:hypothetical protein